MKKLKELFKSKKFIVGLILVVIIAVAVVAFLLTRDKDEDKVLKTEIHTMYVKINPLVKLTFEVSYYECLNENNEKDVCGESTNLITDYELINDDAKEFYKDIDFKGKDVMASIITLCDTARDNNVGFNSLEITSDYKFDKEKIVAEIKSGSKYDTTYNVFVDFEEHINEQEIIDDTSEGPLVTYTVKFDSKGGSNIDDVVVRENDTILKPVNPTKKGYEFVSWQLNGKDYDFQAKITKNITLTAKWKKIESEEVVKEEETKKIEWDFSCSSIKFANVGEGLLAKCSDKYKPYDVDLTVTKSLADKHKNRGELLKYLTFTVDLNGKKVGNYEADVQVTSSNKGITAVVTEKVDVEVHKKPVSTLSKINLNENIMIYLGHAFFTCSDSTILFADNLEELYPDLIKKDSQGNKTIYLIDDEWKEDLIKDGEWNEAEHGKYNPESKFKAKFDQIKWNTDKEAEVNKVITEIKNEVVPGIANFGGRLENHTDFNYTYNYITIYDADMFSELDKELSLAHKKTFDKLDNVLDGYTALSYYGGCGDIPGEELLNEELCDQFHLNCARW